MSTQLQQRAVQVTGRLSAVARSASRRIRATQQAILKEEAEREEKEKRLFNGRLSRARHGLRRFLAFASSRPIQRLVKVNERVNGKGRSLSFHELNCFGTSDSSATGYVSFSIGLQGVMVAMTNTCWRRMDVIAVFPFKKKSEVIVHTKFVGRDESAWQSSVRDVLNQMATGLMSSLNEISEESENALRVLGLWSRSAPFERTAIAFLEQLERQVASELRRRK